MPLILTSQIKSIKSREDKISIYINAPKDVFTETYNLIDGDSVFGFIENVGIWESYMRETASSITFEDISSIMDRIKEIKLKLMYIRGEMGSYDYLFFHSEWEKIRDYGILPNYNFLRIRIESVQSIGKEISVFPYRDVKIVVD